MMANRIGLSPQTEYAIRLYEKASSRIGRMSGRSQKELHHGGLILHRRPPVGGMRKRTKINYLFEEKVIATATCLGESNTFRGNLCFRFRVTRNGLDDDTTLVDRIERIAGGRGLVKPSYSKPKKLLYNRPQ